MLQLDFTTFPHWWSKRRNGGQEKASRAQPPPLERPSLDRLAAMDEEALPLLVRQDATAMRYLRLLGALNWSEFPERDPHRAWPGPTPAPRAPYVAAYLVKLEEQKRYMSDLRRFLVEHPALVWVLGFPLVLSDDPLWGFDVEASVPSRKQFGRVLRNLRSEQVAFLLRETVHLLDQELPSELLLGDEISLDTKHIIAWVRENNPKERIPDRFNKEQQPAGDKDCKLRFRPNGNQRKGKSQAGKAETPAKEGVPASQRKEVKEGEWLWGYASGVVATKMGDWGEFVLAEFTQTFDRSDASYFFPLMEQVEANLGRKPRFGALDAAYDAFFVHDYFYQAGGFAAVPWADRADHRKQFDAEGLPLCAAGLPMPLKSTFMRRSHCLVPHRCGRYGCPVAGSTEGCPVDHPNWEKRDGCITTLPTSPGCRLRHELDRESAEYKALYRQRTATERINSQAVKWGIERPKLRNGQAIANQCTLIYVLINLHALERVRRRRAERQGQGDAR